MTPHTCMACSYRRVVHNPPSHPLASACAPPVAALRAVQGDRGAGIDGRDGLDGSAAQLLLHTPMSPVEVGAQLSGVDEGHLVTGGLEGEAQPAELGVGGPTDNRDVGEEAGSESGCGISGQLCCQVPPRVTDVLPALLKLHYTVFFAKQHKHSVVAARRCAFSVHALHLAQSVQLWHQRAVDARNGIIP
eukprot:CAMPEP_0202906978 /NCGR_PEP_ID=MMETSP1392-20130828/40900_1 /ASSEMBLY_ACC=CAM_ASM_000868 /TAXON_ID=225041 /ORGANISM="Chlamydomonas chlamydogama, Strain SAG 11-48b" /LENGTH=189 /DNA_ID=CAMNT_0049595689 /DNA_START=180 /DNA_END=749 /DNA_ORIENTATION=-